MNNGWEKWDDGGMGSFANISCGARSAVQNDPELRKYYDRKAKEGKEHGVIMNAVKFKLITRVFAVVNRGTSFVKLHQAG